MQSADGEAEAEDDNNESDGAADDSVDGGVEVGEVGPDLLPVTGGLVVGPLGCQARPGIGEGLSTLARSNK